MSNKIDYPARLTPNSFENFEINNQIVEVPKCIVEFEKWNGNPLNFTFGGKGVLNFNNSPMFAELVIMNIFKEAGWNSRWIETYGKSKLNPIYLSEWIDENYKSQINNPIENKLIQILLNQIAKNNNNNFGGCWDVVAWKNDHLIFAESKKSKKDSIKSTQNNWLKSALELGFSVENFLMVEWNTK